MQSTTIFSVFLLVNYILAQDVDWLDIPGVCYPVCWAVVNLSQGCAHTVGDGNYINCVCENKAAADWIPNCQACIAAVWKKDTDVNSLLDSCSLTSTTWTGATTATGSATAIPTTNEIVTTEGTGTVTFTTASASETASASITSGSTRTSNTGASRTASTASAFTGAAAPVATACLGMAGLLMGIQAML